MEINLKYKKKPENISSKWFKNTQNNDCDREMKIMIIIKTRAVSVEIVFFFYISRNYFSNFSK